MTIVESADTFWPPFKTPFFVVVPELTTTQQPPNDFDWLYEGCGDTKVCFGIPNNCIETRDCNLFGGVIHNEGEFDFELLSLGKKLVLKTI